MRLALWRRSDFLDSPQRACFRRATFGMVVPGVTPDRGRLAPIEELGIILSVFILVHLRLDLTIRC